MLNSDAYKAASGAAKEVTNTISNTKAIKGVKKASGAVISGAKTVSGKYKSAKNTLTAAKSRFNNTRLGRVTNWATRRTAAATAGLAALAISTASGGTMLEGIGMASAASQGMDELLEGSKRNNIQEAANGLNELDAREYEKHPEKRKKLEEAKEIWDKNGGNPNDEWKAKMAEYHAIETINDDKFTKRVPVTDNSGNPVTDKEGNIQTRELTDEELMQQSNYDDVHGKLSDAIRDYDTKESKSDRFKKLRSKASSITDSEIEKGQKDIESLLRHIIARKRNATKGKNELGANVSVEDLQNADPTAKALSASIEKDFLEHTNLSPEEIAQKFGLDFLKDKGGVDESLYKDMIDKIAKQQEMIRLKSISDGLETNRQLNNVDGRDESLKSIVDDNYDNKLLSRMSNKTK